MESAASFIEEVVAGDRVYLTISRPDRRNALGPNLIFELNKILQKIEKKQADPPYQQIRGVVIRAKSLVGRSGPIWGGGGDLKELAPLSQAAAKNYSQSATRLCQTIENFFLPVIALIDGAAIGGSAEFALACDIRIATTDASLNFKQARIGLPTGFGGASRLVRLVGLAKAQGILFLAKELKAFDAKELGLFHEVFNTREEADKFLDEAFVIISGGQKRSYQIQKEMLNKASLQQDEIYAFEIERFMQCWGNTQHQKILQSFKAD